MRASSNYRSVTGREDTSIFPALFKELAGRGWQDAELRKLTGENFLRELQQAGSTVDDHDH